MRIEVSEAEAGKRVDQVVADRLGISRTQARKLILQGAVRRDGRRALDKGQTAVSGDVYLIADGARDVAALPDDSLPLHVRHEDAWLVVVEKPVGMPTHPLESGELGCLANLLVAHYPEMRHIGYDERQPGLVNRLDNDTSGLVLAARDEATFTALRELLDRDEIAKRYLALTEVRVPSGEITSYLEPRGRRVASHAMLRDGSRLARTKVLGCEPRTGGTYLVEVEASRAYRHQVRVHLAERGAPLVGDVLYGGSPAAHHHLHASRLTFVHPHTGQTLDLHSPLPLDWP